MSLARRYSRESCAAGRRLRAAVGHVFGLYEQNQPPLRGVGAVSRGREQGAADQSRDDLVVLGPAEAHVAVGLAEGDVARGELVPEEYGAACGSVLEHGGHEQKLLEAGRVGHSARLGRGPQLPRRLVDVAKAHLLRALDLGKLRRQPAGLEGAPHIARD
jgi:hypothetical protein